MLKFIFTIPARLPHFHYYAITTPPLIRQPFSPRRLPIATLIDAADMLMPHWMPLRRLPQLAIRHIRCRCHMILRCRCRGAVFVIALMSLLRFRVYVTQQHVGIVVTAADCCRRYGWPLSLRRYQLFSLHTCFFRLPCRCYAAFDY